MNKLKIALDFDDTLTADLKLWSTFVENAKGAGHQVYLVTARRETEENCELINSILDHWGCQMPIIFTNLGSKILATQRRGIQIDIWIDDDPKSLVHGR